MPASPKVAAATTTAPKGLVTREQMAVFLVRAVEGDPPANYCGGSSYFSDVLPSAWSCPHIQRLSELNITGGCGGGNYCPQGLVTRDQMAAFIVRAVEGEPALDYCGSVAPFKDVSPNAWSCRYIKRLAEIGVTQGCGNGYYCPYAPVNREQMAAFLARAFLDMD
jgi:rubredoxin